jgi:hypothetical protein
MGMDGVQKASCWVIRSELTHLAIVLAGEEERFGEDAGAVRANDTNFGLVDQPIGYAKVRNTVFTGSGMAIPVHVNLVR